MKVNFFFPETVQFDKSMNPSFSDTWVLVYRIFFTTDAKRFGCFDIIYSTEVSGFFVSCFISLYSPQTLFIKKNSYDW